MIREMILAAIEVHDCTNNKCLLSKEKKDHADSRFFLPEERSSVS